MTTLWRVWLETGSSSEGLFGVALRLRERETIASIGALVLDITTDLGLPLG